MTFPQLSLPPLLSANVIEQCITTSAGQRRWLGRLTEGLTSYAVAQMAIAAPAKLFVIVTNDAQQVGTIEAELKFLGINTAVFPDWETLPYDRLSAHQDIISERLAILSQMPNSGVLIVAASTFTQRIAPASWLLGQHFDLAYTQKMDLALQRERLVRSGYRQVDTVYSPGEFAVRGSLFDIFPMGQVQPLRLDFFDDVIEHIYLFDVETQRTTETITSFRVLPAYEYPLIEGRSTFRARFAELFPELRTTRIGWYQDVLSGINASGLGYYLPLFFEHEDMQQSGTLFDYLPAQTQFIIDEQLQIALDTFYEALTRQYESRRHDIEYPLLAPELLFMQSHELFARMKQFGRIVVSHEAVVERAGAFDAPVIPKINIGIDSRAQDTTQAFKQFAQTYGGRILIVAYSAGRRELLKDMLQPVFGPLRTVESFAEFIASANTMALIAAPLERGMYLGAHCAVIVESQLLGQRIPPIRTRARQNEAPSDFLVRSLSELAVGAPIVHIEHGIGRYAGLVNLPIDGQLHELLEIRYADDAKVYVPVAQLHTISRYGSGDPEHAPLHKLGTDVWAKSKHKALEKIHDVAAELLDVQARREAKPGIHFSVDMLAYAQFSAGFGFEETLDQTRAIEAVLADMQSVKTMDRLICGDVGFGKTEVAMRAAFVAAMSGYQVAILVPTTLLAQQHFETFNDRFANWPVRIEVLSRFGANQQHRHIIQDVALGKVDIVIGTHKLLQPNICFVKLGLMVIDEEHRFGVRDKEKIKALRANVDMLTLTATPIPRTLNLAYSGLRDLSIISTPPAKRLAIKTFVMERQDGVLKEAILRELLRGGQVYVLHNDIDSIERAAENIRQLVPEARVVAAHGQMRERELERVMHDFYHKQFNVLVCTTIIETGIDVPSANTMIIDRADKLGLAQLHQLRGRVGRSHHQAYAYMLVPSIKHLNRDAQRRLEAISRASDLGAGFILAAEDLEIRGAGEILGDEQSGHMQAIGYSLYMEMLTRAAKAIAAGKTPQLDMPLDIICDISLHVPALIPDGYMGDVHQRLLFYKQISNTQTEAELLGIRIELIDRFGLFPQELINLFEIHRIRHLTQQLGVQKLVMHARGGVLEFSQDTPLRAKAVIWLLQSMPTQLKMDGGQRIKLNISLEDSAARIEWVKTLLANLLQTHHQLAES